MKGYTARQMCSSFVRELVRWLIQFWTTAGEEFEEESENMKISKILQAVTANLNSSSNFIMHTYLDITLSPAFTYDNSLH